MKKEKGRNIFKKTMAKNHPELMKKLNYQIQNIPSMEEDKWRINKNNFTLT